MPIPETIVRTGLVVDEQVGMFLPKVLLVAFLVILSLNGCWEIRHVPSSPLGFVELAVPDEKLSPPLEFIGLGHNHDLGR